MEKRYSISDAARQVMVEAHVLRYWEEELGLHIQRNVQGHRYYSESDIRMLKSIKDLKEQGFQLKAIKLALPDIQRIRHMMPQELYKLREELNQQVQIEEEALGKVTPLPTGHAQLVVDNSEEAAKKLRQFEEMMRRMVGEIMREEAKASEERICEVVTTRLLKESDYMMRQREELQEKQIELLQKILEEMRSTVPEAAASKELPEYESKKNGKKSGKKRKLFAKNKI